MVAFSSQFKQISSFEDIEEMINMAKIQRSFVIFTLPFGGGAVLLYLYYGLTGLLQTRDLVVMVVLIVINSHFTKKVKELEKSITEIPTANDELEKKKQHVIHIWHKTLFGDF